MPNEPMNGNPAGADFYPLDETTIAVFAEGTEQLKHLNSKMVGVMELFLRQHNLEGRWQLAQNGREIQRMPAPQPVPVQPGVS